MSRTATPKDLLPDAHCVLGTMLRPFSLGHHLLLTRLDSPYASDPKAESDPAEFSLAVFLCAGRYPEILAAHLAGDLAAEHARWLHRIRTRWWQRTRFNEAAERVKFQSYLTAGYARPPVMRDLGGLVKFTSPWETLLLCRLARGGFAPAEVQEMYLPAAWYHYHTLREIFQADAGGDPAKWRPVFYTEEMHARLRAIAPTPATN